MKFRYFLVFLVLLASSTALLATHNRAGEITYEQIGPLTFRATITTYTKTTSVPADRDSLEICWGDGSCEFVLRVNGPLDPNGVPQGDPLPNNIKFNQYIATHTYPARAMYTISMTDPNRNGDILNVNPPNSDQVPFHLATELFILNPQFQGTNSTPTLLQPP
ncbi:MAG: gliding motility-associated C-terminal domain-containing protein, partial [Bacteroidota bacterium]